MYCPALSSVNSVSKSGVRIRSHAAKRLRPPKKITTLKNVLDDVSNIGSTFPYCQLTDYCWTAYTSTLIVTSLAISPVFAQ